jgi:hypothetical protein
MLRNQPTVKQHFLAKAKEKEEPNARQKKKICSAFALYSVSTDNASLSVIFSSFLLHYFCYNNYYYYFHHHHYYRYFILKHIDTILVVCRDLPIIYAELNISRRIRSLVPLSHYQPSKTRCTSVTVSQFIIVKVITN